MRPVTRGARPVGPNPPAYAWNIRVNSYANLRNDSKARTLTFNRQAIQNVFGTRSPTLWQLTRALRQLAVDEENDTLPDAGFAGLKKRIVKRLSGDDGYKPAAGGLLVRLGPFCSYCDQHLPGQIAVEHCIPKAAFPLTQLSWDNFLFGCEACNGQTGKGTRPSRTTVNGWGGAYNTDLDRYNAIRNRYFWPDIHTDTYRELLPQFLNNWMGVWGEVPGPDSVWLGMQIQGDDPIARRVTARISYNGWAYNNVEVSVRPRQSTADTLQSVTYYGLDRPGGVTGSIQDRRMYNRTKAWFTVIALLGPLDNWNVMHNANLFQTVWAGIVAAAPAVGFFSVWVRVLALCGGSTTYVPGTNVTLMTRFLNDTAAGFPGTDTAQVP